MKNFINFDDFDKESVEEAIEIGINCLLYTSDAADE